MYLSVEGCASGDSGCVNPVALLLFRGSQTCPISFTREVGRHPVQLRDALNT